MPTYSAGDVVRVPFPYTDRNPRQFRPALVISHEPVGPEGQLLWVAMITSAAHRPWPGDFPIDDLQAAGLRAPSIIRPHKIATIDASAAAPLGRISATLRAVVAGEIGRVLGAELADPPSLVPRSP